MWKRCIRMPDKGYTEKQWGRSAKELPAFIIRRVPFRFVYDNNYFNDRYQGIPEGGYNKLIDALLEGIEVRLNTDFFTERTRWEDVADCICLLGVLMNILIINADIWNIVVCDLKKNTGNR